MLSSRPILLFTVAGQVSMIAPSYLRSSSEGDCVQVPRGQPGPPRDAQAEGQSRMSALLGYGAQMGPMGTGRTSENHPAQPTASKQDAKHAEKQTEKQADKEQRHSQAQARERRNSLAQAMFGAPVRGSGWLAKQPTPGLYGQGVNPFFQVRSTDEVGKFVCLLGPADGLTRPPRAFVMARDGCLYWLAEEGSIIHVLSPTLGYHSVRVESETHVKALALDSEGALYYFGDGTLGTLTRALKPAPDRSEVSYRNDYWPWTAGPGVVIPGGQGEFWASSGQRIYLICGCHLGNPWWVGMEDKAFTTATAMAYDPENGMIYWLTPGQDVIHWFAGGEYGQAPLEPGSKPRDLLLTPKGGLVVTLEGRDEIFFFGEPTCGKEGTWSLRTLGEGPQGPHGLALDSRGNLWVTLKAAGKVLRCSHRGETRLFRLPIGKTPTTIRAAPDGRMIIALENLPGFVSVTAVPQAMPDYLDAGKAAPEWDIAPAKSQAPSRDARKVSRAQRHRRHDELIARAEAKALAQASVAAPASAEAKGEEDSETYLPAEPAPAPAGRESVAASAAPPVAAAPLKALDRLARINVFVTAKRLGHAHRFHGYGKDRTKSQFAQRYQTQDQFLELLARCLESADRDGMLGLIVDGEDAFVTFCDLGEIIGWYNPGDGSLTETRWVKVVTARYRDPEQSVDEHYLINFYPVLEPW